MLIVDGTDQELVSSILETELDCIEQRHSKIYSFWDNLAAMGPAWGMIGTLIGLINMLKRLDDPSSIGPNMAVALVTTLYGSLIANWISIPIATKPVSYTHLIDMSADQKERLLEATCKAKAKGMKESLVMVDDFAFIVNVKNNLVITAVNDTKNAVFTNIDGAIIN